MQVLNTIEHLAIMIASPTRLSVAVTLTSSKGALTFKTPKAPPLSIPLSAAGCKFEIRKSEPTDPNPNGFIGSAFVSMDKMSSIFDAKLFPHLFNLFNTLQEMLTEWATHMQQHTDQLRANTPTENQQMPTVEALHIERIDVVLKGIEVGARADHQMLVLSTKDFRLVLFDVLGGGIDKAPTADVDFGRIHVKLHGEHRIHSALDEGQISSNSPKVLDAKTHVKMFHKLDMTQTFEELSTKLKMQIGLNDTSIIVHPSCVEHVTNFLQYFADEFVQSREDFNPDTEELEKMVQPLMNESVELIKKKSAKNIEKFKKNLKAGSFNSLYSTVVPETEPSVCRGMASYSRVYNAKCVYLLCIQQHSYYEQITRTFCPVLLF